RYVKKSTKITDIQSAGIKAVKKEYALGKVWLVGAGPGDPELLTVKAVRVIEAADIIFFDQLVSPVIRELFPKTTPAFYVGKEKKSVIIERSGWCAQASVYRRLSTLKLYSLLKRLTLTFLINWSVKKSGISSLRQRQLSMLEKKKTTIAIRKVISINC